MSGATVSVIENIIEPKELKFSVDAGATIESIIREKTDGDQYNSTLVECYDCDTGMTSFVPISDDNDTLNVTITVNGKDVPLDYRVRENDIVSILFLPADFDADVFSWASAAIGNVLGSLYGALTGFLISGGNPFGALIGAGIGGTIGFFAGGFGQPAARKWLESLIPKAKDGTHKNGLESNKLPDVRGAQNEPITGKVFPCVLGKILAAPPVIGSPYNEIYGDYGNEIYINALYIVGYSPLRITELKLGEQPLAHNCKWSGNENMKNVFHGVLSGTHSFDGKDTGDIVNTWSNNDIKVEILQQGQNGESIDWGTIYPFAKIQDDVDANVLFIVDGDKDVNPLVSYKGISLKNGLRNNPVRLTRQCPLSARIELDFPSGLFKTRSNSDDDGNSTVEYSSIPLWVAMQWRVYSKYNAPSDGEESGVISGEMNPLSPDYWENAENPVRGWHSFENVNSIDGTPSCEFDLQGTGTFNYTITESRPEPYRPPKCDTKMTSSIPIDMSFVFDAPATEDMNVSYKMSVQVIVDYAWSWSSPPKSGYETFKSPVYTSTCNGTISIGENTLDISKTFTPNISIFGNQSTGVRYTPSKQTVKITISQIECNGEILFGDTVIEKTTDVSDYPWTDNQITFTENFYKNRTVERNNLFHLYTNEKYSEDKSAHSGNTLEGIDYNDGWIGSAIFNFESLCGSWEKQDGINEFRAVSEVNFERWARKNLTYTDEEDFINKFREYFLPTANTTKSIEVRVVRISPNYLNERTNTNKHSAYQFNDIFIWKTLTSTMFNEDRLINNGTIEQVRPLSDEDMRNHCVIAIRAKTDNTDQLGNVMRKFSCIAQSFAPYFDDDSKHWVPTRISGNAESGVYPVMKYFRPNVVTDTGSVERGEEITREQFIQDRQSEPKVKSMEVPDGNNFVRDIVSKVIRIPGNMDSNGRYIIPEDTPDSFTLDGWNLNPMRYLENNVASVILLSGVGRLLGINALSYDDFDLVSLGKIFNECKHIVDGSTYNSDGWHYTHDGTEVYHQKGENVDMYFTANAYIYDAVKYEELLSGLCMACRTVFTRTSGNKITFIMDKPEKYHVALINQANTLSSSYMMNFETPPAGIMTIYKNEDDGFEQNEIYCMNDAEYKYNHRGMIEQYAFKYVTNSYQMYSLGRYLLANRIMNRELITKKIGMEGYSIGLGNIVCVQDDTIMLGTDTGGRITRLLEDDDTVYGFLINNTYHYTGETEEYNVGNGTTAIRSRQGVVIMQPAQGIESRVINLRLAVKGTTFDIDGKSFVVKKGDTNVVLFDEPLGKNSVKKDGQSVYRFSPQVDNIVGFGEIGNESALYRVIKIKQDNKHNYEFTLIKYNEKLYSYGRQIPSFQSNITPPSYSDSYNFTNAATPSDLTAAVKQASDITVAKGLSIIAPDGTVFKNGMPASITLQANPSGYTPESYSWYKDGTLIPDATDDELEINSAGTYKCSAPSLYSDFEAYITIVAVNDGEAEPVYTCELSMSAVGSAVSLNVYKDGTKATGTLYYSDFYGIGTNGATTAGVAKQPFTDGSAAISAVTNANKHLVRIYSDADATNLLCTGFVSYGTTGSATDGYSYWMITDATAIKADAGGAFTPSSITLKGKRAIGSGSPQDYSGRFVIKYTTDGSSWTPDYTSSVNESSKTYSVKSGTKALQCSFYLAGGTATLLDEDVIPVTVDGNDNKTIMALLSNGTVTVPSNNDGTSPVLTETGTAIQVYENETLLLYASTLADGKWKVDNVSNSNCTSPSVTSATAGAITAMTADSASRTFTIKGKRTDGTDFTTEVTQTFSKAKRGQNGGYMKNLFVADEFGQSEENLRARTDWQDAPPALQDGQCLYMATKWIEGE